ncbi:MAG: YlxR family protein [Chloroflexi bacterium]|nr:YlxR family protein [Chloroflexota bacterium]
MAKRKQPRRVKHVPQRTCVACREVQAKGTLVRLVRTPEGVFPDTTGKLAGRGAYLHAKRECWERGITHALPNALRTQLTDEDRQRLTRYFEELPAGITMG